MAIREPTRRLTQEPTKDTAQEPTQDTAQEPTEDNTQEPHEDPVTNKPSSEARFLYLEELFFDVAKEATAEELEQMGVGLGHKLNFKTNLSGPEIADMRLYCRVTRDSIWMAPAWNRFLWETGETVPSDEEDIYPPRDE